jgi:peroxiredoxin
MIRKTPIILAVIAFISLVMISCSTAKVLEVGDKAPDFTLESIDGKSMSLSDFRGKTVVLYVWATTCKTCLETEMPHLQILYDSWPNDETVVLAINDFNELKTVQDEVKSRGFTFNFLLDPEHKIREQYCCGTGYPLIIIITPDGIYEKKNIGGFQSQQEMESWFESL